MNRTVSAWRLAAAQAFLVCVTAGMAGCDRGTAATSSDKALAAVQQTVATQLSIPVGKVKPDSTLGQLGAGDLDLVELVMELEDAFGVSIADAAIAAAAEGRKDKPQNAITIQEMADLVRNAPKAAVQHGRKLPSGGAPR